MQKHAVYCGTKNIYNDMEIAAKSLIANSNVDFVHFLIEDDTFPIDVPQIIQCHNVSNQQFFKSGTPNMKSKFSYMAMMRIALCHIFDNLDIILSLDCDTFVVNDISSIWNIPLNECYFSATPEWHRTKKNGLTYCNHGVVLYNLAKLRDGKADECIEVLNNKRYTFVDQDVANYLCQGHIHNMPVQYNVNDWTCRNHDVDPYIIHFAGISRNKWTKDPLAIEWKNISWDKVMSMHTEKVMQHQYS